jgi:hypothetical protein
MELPSLCEGVITRYESAITCYEAAPPLLTRYTASAHELYISHGLVVRTSVLNVVELGLKSLLQTNELSLTKGDSMACQGIAKVC